MRSGTDEVSYFVDTSLDRSTSARSVGWQRAAGRPAAGDPEHVESGRRRRLRTVGRSVVDSGSATRRVSTPASQITTSIPLGRSSCAATGHGTDGVARFTTIYPGWYPGRTVHIHFKIRSAPTAKAGFEFTSQLYFDDALTDRVHTLAPYASRGPRTRRNDRDGIYRHGGTKLHLAMTEKTGIHEGTLDIALEGVGAARS